MRDAVFVRSRTDRWAPGLVFGIARIAVVGACPADDPSPLLEYCRALDGWCGARPSHADQRKDHGRSTHGPAGLSTRRLGEARRHRSHPSRGGPAI